MNSLIEQKARVARLRDLYEKETDSMIKEYMRGSLSTARLLHDIVECGVLEPERIERLVVQAEKAKVRAYKSVKYAVIAISIAVLLTIVLFGCNTVDGIGRDLCAVSGPYIQEK